MTDAEEAGAPPHPARAGGVRERAWFDDLFATHVDALHRYFVRRGAGPDSEDLCADVFATAWRRRADLPDEHELAWLYRTAGYLLANFRRKGRPEPMEHLPEDDDSEYAADPADLAVEDALVREVLAQLSAKDRQVLLLHAWEGLDGEGLAHALGLTRGGAAAALSRARARLRRAWREQAG
ncbi:RNA polymerase sigma factor [Ruania zhangjianzhongii]|uniref:RNA polymerase sigma factor n=1 Tax=Ruania zhangjianzhongii TaxID=2603206 RepID=UPI0011C9B40B|nr:RNA polymerase sigma factor [Ruania zhangjianzhongii]